MHPPDLLYLGDDKQNARDRDEHGRTNHATGEKNGQSKLTHEQVEYIRSAHVSLPSHAQQLADQFGVTVSHIYRIRRKERWTETT